MWTPATICLYPTILLRSVVTISFAETIESSFRRKQPSTTPSLLGFRGGASRMSYSLTDRAADNAFTVGGGAINEKKRNLVQALQEQAEPMNEPLRGYNPIRHRSHLWHALEGLDRYPNYLSRWSEEDIDKLEVSLESQLEKVREQKNAILKQRRGIDSMVERLAQNGKWRPFLEPPQTWDDIRDNVLDPRMNKAVFNSKQFTTSKRPSVQEVLSGQVTVELDAHLLEELMEEELFDVYSIPLLTPEVSGLHS